MENENHCDFVKLREMLIRVNMEDLREQTHSRHYELYRRCKLEEMGFQDSDGDSQPFRSALPQPLLSHQHLLSQAWEPAGRGWWEPRVLLPQCLPDCPDYLSSTSGLSFGSPQPPRDV